jgi:hypothetical protein
MGLYYYRSLKILSFERLVRGTVYFVISMASPQVSSDRSHYLELMTTYPDVLCDALLDDLDSSPGSQPLGSLMES